METESIKIKKIQDGKINIFIFVNNDSNSDDKNLLLNSLNTINIDYDNFNVFRFFVTPLALCPPRDRDHKRTVMLDGYTEFANSFIIDPYCILVRSDTEKYSKLVSQKLDSNSINTIIAVNNKVNVSSPFMNFTDHRALIKLITEKKINLSNAIDSLKKQLQKEQAINTELKEKINSIISTDTYLYRIVSFTYSSFLFIKPSSSAINHRSLIINSKVLKSYDLKYYNYPFRKLSNLGYSLGLGYSMYKAQVSISNQNNAFIDTVQQRTYDPNGDPYTRIAYGNALKERISISYMSIAGGLSYKIPLKKESPKGNQVVINGGLKLCNILKSSYEAVSGTMTYGGYYPQYRQEDTIFSGLFDFDQNKPVYKESKRLEMNNTFLSGFASVDLLITPFHKDKWSRLFFSLGLFCETGSNLLFKHSRDNKLYHNSEDYNSLLYRADKLYLKSIGLTVGLAYSL